MNGPSVYLPPGVVRLPRFVTPKHEEFVSCTNCGDHGNVEWAEVWEHDPPDTWLQDHPFAQRIQTRDGRELLLAGYASVSFCRCRRDAEASAQREQVADRGRAELTARAREQTWQSWSNDRTTIVQIQPGPERDVVVSALVRWRPNDGDVLVTGKPGEKRVGKTHALNAMAHVTLTRGIASLVVNLSDLFARERQRDGTSPVEQAIAAPVLFVNDLGTSRLTAWECETLYRLVDRRIEEKRATWWETNLSLDGLLKYLRVPSDPIANENAGRVAMRLTESCRTVYRFERREAR